MDDALGAIQPSARSRRKFGIRAVLFDLDDTLLDSRRWLAAARAATFALARELCPELTEARLEAAWGAVVPEMQGQTDVGELALTTARALDRHRWSRILTRCGLEGADAETLGDRFYASRLEQYRLFPDVLEGLRQLHGSYQLAVLTNGPGEVQREKIAVLGLERWLADVCISGEAGASKPDPECFRHALARLSCEPGEAVMVGDSLRHDIAGAAALGIRTVWVNRHGQRHPASVEPDAILEDLRPLPELLARWG